MKALKSLLIRTKNAIRRTLNRSSIGRRRAGIDGKIYREFRALPIWSAAWYRERYRDVDASGADPLAHFLLRGLGEGRDPSPYYDTPVRLAQRYDALRQDPLACARAIIADVRADTRFTILNDQCAAISGSGLFDAAFYLARNPDVRAAQIPPLQHYLRHGARELRAPGPRFDPSLYVGRQHLATKGPLNPLVHYLLNDGSSEGNVRDQSLLRERALEHTRNMIDVEPELLTALRLLEQDAIPILNAHRNDVASSAWRRMAPRLDRPFRYLVLMPSIRRGGAELVALHAARLALELHGAEQVLVITTDAAESSAPDWLPVGLSVLSLDGFQAGLSLEERVDVMQMAVRALKPRAILNVNSHVGWELYAQYGRALSRFSDLYAALFCPDYDAKGRRIGYAHRYFRSTLPFLSKIYFDNAAFIEELWSFYSPPPRYREKLQVVYQPAQPMGDSDSAILQAPLAFNVLWASRVSKQKNIDVLIDMARLDARLNYRVFGVGDEEELHRLKQTESTMANMQYMGGYTSFHALPLASTQAYVYTALWDGLPNALLAAASAGLPIVAPAIGGIPELVTANTGWLVDDPHDAGAYVDALHHILNHPEEAQRRNDNMRTLVSTRHSWAAYTAAMSNIPSFLAP